MSVLCLNHRVRLVLRLSQQHCPGNGQRYGTILRKPAPPPFPVIASCPSPTCACSATPPNLDIDRSKPLHGTIAPYAEQVLISTGKPDWSSRIEEDEDALFLRELRKLLGRGGKYSDSFHNVMLTLSSFPPEGSCTPGASSSSAYLLPSFRHVHDILLQPDRIETFIQAFVLPQKLHPAHGCLGVEEQNRLLRKPELQSLFYNNRDVDEVLILICGHGGRDERCGVMGPLLHKEFEGALINQGFQFASACKVSPIGIRSKRTARVGLISHIGGHKYAGNTIIYIPPSFVDQSGQVSPLAGRGVWYGRVEPKHVEGIVKETVLRGRVISELFRGAVGQGETTLNL